jgi:WD40 repeat protein
LSTHLCNPDHYIKIKSASDVSTAPTSTGMAKAAQSIITITKPNLSFDSGHKHGISGVTILPYGRGMVTRGQTDKTLRLWEFSMKDRLVLKKSKVHSDWVEAVAVSGDGLSIASGDDKGKLTIWRGDTGKYIRDIKAHSKTIYSLDFSLSGSALATGSSDYTTKLWDTKTWKLQGNPIECGSVVKCVRFSPSGELLAIAANSHIEIWNLTITRKCIAKPKFQDIKSADNISLVWTPDGTRLLSAGATEIPTIWEWNTSTWKQVGDPWVGHTHQINDLAVNPTGTLIASASSDHHVFLWRLSERQTIAVFKHPEIVSCVAFSTDGKHVFSGGFDKTVSEWAVPRVVSLEDVHKEQLKASEVSSQ